MPHTTRMENRQYQDAETQIIDAFFSLLNDYDFNDLTVSQIILESGVNRSTFYRHYKDKYDIIEQMQKDALLFTSELMRMSKKSPQSLVEVISDLSQITVFFSPSYKKRFLQLAKIHSSNFNLYDFMRKGFMKNYTPSPDSPSPEFERTLFADIAFRTVMYQMEHENEDESCALKSVLQSMVDNLTVPK